MRLILTDIVIDAIVQMPANNCCSVASLLTGDPTLSFRPSDSERRNLNKTKQLYKQISPRGLSPLVEMTHLFKFNEFKELANNHTKGAGPKKPRTFGMV